MPVAFPLINLWYCIHQSMPPGTVEHIIASTTPDGPMSSVLEKNIESGIVMRMDKTATYSCNLILLTPLMNIL